MSAAGGSATGSSGGARGPLGPGPEAALLAVALLVLGAIAAWLWATLGALGPALDDAYIHLQFASSLAAGDGMAYRPGEPVSGSTGPLWTALLAVAALLPGSTVHWALLLGAVLTALAVVEMQRLLRALDLPAGLVWLGALLFLASDLVLWSAYSGMELPLFFLLSTLGMRLHTECLGRMERRQRERRGEPVDAAGWATAALCLALASLARPEAALLLALAGGELLVRRLAWRRRGEVQGSWPALLRPLAWAALLAALVLAPVLLFGWWASGDPLPTTYSVKTDDGSRGHPAWRDLWRIAEVLFRSLPLCVLAAGAGAAALLGGALEGRAAQRRRSWLPLLWLIGLPLAYSALTAEGSAVPLGNFGRYAFVLTPALVAVACLGFEGPWRALHRRLGASAPTGLGDGEVGEDDEGEEIAGSPTAGPTGPSARPTTRPRQAAVAALLAAALLAPTLLASRSGLARLQRNVYDIAVGDVAMARWISANVDPRVVLGAQDIGALGYLTGNPLFDLVGIVDPKVIPVVKSPGDPLLRLRRLLDLARQEGVGLMVLFPESYGGLRALAAAAPGEWRVVHEIEIPGNITLAGSRLVAVVPPWAARPAASAPPRPAAQGDSGP
ncbi:MAG: hypothetical protein DWQ36_12805 [Acidobacteria bacterium]|nr:MAG: hypothetical protein DWQ36_12805 [Acidobacteriota bacterium]